MTNGFFGGRTSLAYMGVVYLQSINSIYSLSQVCLMIYVMRMRVNEMGSRGLVFKY